MALTGVNNIKSVNNYGCGFHYLLLREPFPKCEVNNEVTQSVFRLCSAFNALNRKLSFARDNQGDSSVKRNYFLALTRFIVEFEQEVVKYAANISAKNCTSIEISSWCMRQENYLNSLTGMLLHTNNFSGGDILNFLFNYSLHPGQFRETRGLELFLSAICPVLQCIKEWITAGVLREESGMFFITRNGDASSCDSWSSTFSIAKKSIPMFISTNLSNSIFQIGKNKHFASQMGILMSAPEENLVSLLSTGTNFLSSQRKIEYYCKAYENETNISLCTGVLQGNELLGDIALMREVIFCCNGNFARDLVILFVKRNIKNKITSVRSEIQRELNFLIQSQFLEGESTGYAASRTQLVTVEESKIANTSKHVQIWDLITLKFHLPLKLEVFFHTESWYALQNVIFQFFFRLRYLCFEMNQVWFLRMYYRKAAEYEVINNGLVELILQQIELTMFEVSRFINGVSNSIYQDVVERFWNNCSKKLQSCVEIDYVVNCLRKYCTDVKSEINPSSGRCVHLMQLIQSVFQSVSKFLSLTRNILSDDLYSVSSPPDLLKLLRLIILCKQDFLGKHCEFIAETKLRRGYSWITSLTS